MNEVKAYLNMIACALYDWKQLKRAAGVLIRDTQESMLVMEANMTPQNDNDVLWIVNISDFDYTTYCTNKIIVKNAGGKKGKMAPSQYMMARQWES